MSSSSPVATPEKFEVEHIAANHSVYFTKDYSRFKSILGNRLLNENKINKIIAEIQAGFNKLRYYPIVVDKNLNVLDGQHRLYIARKLKQNIYYLIDTDEKQVTLYEIAKTNSNTERWKPKDFIHCFCVQGNKHYLKLREFQDKHDLDNSTCMVLLSGGFSDGGNFIKKEVFESGQFEVKNEEFAEKIAFLIQGFEKFSGYKSRAFIMAIAKLHSFGKCKMDELKRKFDMRPEVLTAQANTKQYLKVLEELYNSGRHSRAIIFE